MQLRRFAAFLIGCWLMGSLAMDVTAITNFRTVDRFLAEPGIGAAASIHDMGRDRVRVLLRRSAGEANIFLFEQWEWLQLGIGVGLLLVLVFGGRGKAAVLLCLAMLAVVMAGRFFLTPRIAELGRLVEFLPADPQLAERKAFGMYHGISSSLELVKVALGIAVTALLLIRRAESRRLS